VIGAIAPSTRLAVYAAAVVSVYMVSNPRFAILWAALLLVSAFGVIAVSGRPVTAARWRTVIVFVAWVFVMRLALDLVVGVPFDDRDMWLAAGRQASRVAVLGIGVLALISVTSARDIVDELEGSRLPRSARLLVMMIVQYPRVLRDRYEQIVEAQVARGAERPRTIVQRLAHGASLLLPVMQSELNAVGDRAGLIHLRGLDVELPASAARGRTAIDRVMLGVATIIVIGSIVVRLAA
jgi:hypothetical protein